MDLTSLKNWTPPDGWTTITTLDLHTEGEPLRVITGGFPEILGDTILERRRYAREHFDHLRTLLMWEPRGHADMYGCIITPPVAERADFGVLFIHNEGFSTMCGHGIIAVTTAAVESGMIAAVEPETRVGIDSPAGFIEAFAQVADGRVQSVRFLNVPSFVAEFDAVVVVPGLGEIRYDLAFGGAFYAYVDAADVGVGLGPGDAQELIEKGMAVKRAVMQSRTIEHPEDADLGFLYGTIFVGSAHDPANHSRNVCIFAEGEVDRSPTGTGVSGRVVIHHARGELSVGEEAVIESILGTTFTASVRETMKSPFQGDGGGTRVGDVGFDTVIPEVSGRAWITGSNTFCLDPDDPLKHGFILR